MISDQFRSNQLGCNQLIVWFVSATRPHFRIKKSNILEVENVILTTANV